MTVLLNIPEIDKNIKTKHTKFMKNFGSLSDKIEADHRLAVEKHLAKLTRIMTALLDNDVIDDAKVSGEGIYKTVTLSRDGCNNHVTIWIDVNHIILRPTDLLSASNVSAHNSLESMPIFNVDSVDFDWIDFSDKLLDYVHYVIYSRKDVARQRIDNLLSQ